MCGVGKRETAKRDDKAMQDGSKGILIRGESIINGNITEILRIVDLFVFVVVAPGGV